MKLTSTAFNDGETIPKKYGRDFENINPPLTISHVPKNAMSLVLIMEDPDVPESAEVDVWDHWVVFNIPPETREIKEEWVVEGAQGVGTRGELGYRGPKPPDKEHRYFFKLFALDTTLKLDEGANKKAILSTMQDHIIESTELMGHFAPQ